MNRILAALDLSAYSDRAFDRAARLAAEHGAELVVAHVLPYDADAAARKRAERELDGYASGSRPEPRRLVVSGDPARGLAELARETAADLVVLGRHHESLVGDLLFETVAQFTIRHCGAPVLLVEDRALGPYRRALVGADFSECARRALGAALRWAPQARIHLLHVYETPYPQLIHFSEEELTEFQDERLAQIEKDIREVMRRFLAQDLESARSRIEPMLERNDVDTGLAGVIRRLRPDLLVMGMSGMGFATPGGRTRGYLNDPPCDMLVAA